MDQGDVETVLFPDLAEFEPVSDSLDEEERPLSSWAKVKIGTFQARLEHYIAARESKGLLKYGTASIPTSLLMQLVNVSFGFNGWSLSIVDCVCVLELLEGDRYSMAQRATVRITLQDGTCVEAEGVGEATNMPHKYMCHGTSKKMAITNGLRKGFLKFADLLAEDPVKTEQKLR